MDLIYLNHKIFMTRLCGLSSKLRCYYSSVSPSQQAILMVRRRKDDIQANFKVSHSYRNSYIKLFSVLSKLLWLNDSNYIDRDWNAKKNTYLIYLSETHKIIIFMNCTSNYAPLVKNLQTFSGITSKLLVTPKFFPPLN